MRGQQRRHYLMMKITKDKYKALIFDVDGSLVDSMWIWGAIDREYLAAFGHEVPEGLQMEIGGLSMKETALYFQERFGITDTQEKMMSDWNDMAYEKYRTSVPLKPGAEKLLRFCRENGILCGIATSNSEELAGVLLEHLGIREYFDQITTGSHVSKGKPDPEIYLLTAGNLGVRPEDCLVFEDIVPGIRAGLAAGMQVCSVWDEAAADQQELKEALSHYSIRDFRDVVYA